MSEKAGQRVRTSPPLHGGDRQPRWSGNIDDTGAASTFGETKGERKILLDIDVSELFVPACPRQKE